MISSECFKDDDDLTNALYDSMEANIAGDYEKGGSKMAETKLLY